MQITQPLLKASPAPVSLHSHPSTSSAPRHTPTSGHQPNHTDAPSMSHTDLPKSLLTQFLHLLCLLLPCLGLTAPSLRPSADTALAPVNSAFLRASTLGLDAPGWQEPTRLYVCNLHYTSHSFLHQIDIHLLIQHVSTPRLPRIRVLPRSANNDEQKKMRLLPSGASHLMKTHNLIKTARKGLRLAQLWAVEGKESVIC